jgi:branched-chain amino acid transport system permease protein
VIAGMIAGVSGVLLANQAEFVSPAYAAWQRSGDLIFVIVLGGIGSLHGAIIGAGVFSLLADLLSHYTEHWALIFGPVLILVVLFARGGIGGLLGSKS